MRNKPTKAFLFRRLLPLIYIKIIKEGYKHGDVADWLRKNNYLDITPAMFTTYLNRHGKVEEETLRYQKYLEEKKPKWYEASSDVTDSLGTMNDSSTPQSIGKRLDWFNKDFDQDSYISNNSDDPSQNINVHKPYDNRKSNNVSKKESIAKLVNSKVGPSPTDNPYKDSEHPLEALKRKKALSNIPPTTIKKKGE